MTEYGGCLWFESNKRERSDTIELDCGRSAIQYIINTNNYQRVWIPIFNCPSVFRRINNGCSVSICDYNIDRDFLPIIEKEKFKKGDLLIWINYWGVMSNKTINSIVLYQKKYEVDVLFDNSMAYFCEAIHDCYNVYSCRKFIGVPDGAYIKGRVLYGDDLKTYDTAKNYLFLLEASEKGSDKVYDDYLNNERRFDNNIIPYAMPELTRRIISLLDIEYIKQRRKANFQVLNDALGRYNQLLIDYETETPFVYPFLSDIKFLRKKLIDNHVYVSQHWKSVLESDKSNCFEKLLAENVIPLPIDQRYDKDDMLRLAEMVLEFLV